MKTWLKSRTILVLTLIFSLIFVAACSNKGSNGGSGSGSAGGNSSSSSSSSSGSSSASSGEGGSGAAGEIERLVFAQSADTQAIEPYNGTSTNSATINFQMFNALTKTTPDGEVIGDLAESFEAIDDYTWQFKLKQGVRFHNGEPFNAETVKFSVERMLNPEKNFGLAADFAFIKEVQIVDEYTVNIVTHEPSNGVPLRLIYLVMTPPQYIAEVGDEEFAKKPVGTGPFKFREYVKDDHVTLVRNDDYFGGPSKIKELVFRPIPEEASRIAALEAGEVDLITGLSVTQAKRLAENPDYVVENFPTTRVVYIGFNMRSDTIVQSKEFRQALNYAVDVDSIIENVLEGNGKRIATIFLDHFQGYSDEIEPYPYDPEKAKELLAKSGYNNEPLTLVISTANGNLKEVVETVADQLRKIGVNVTVMDKENALLRQELAAGEIDPLYLYAIGGPYNSAELISRIGFGTQQRYSTYWNAEMDDLRQRASSTQDLAQSDALWKEYQEKIKEEAPAIFLFQQYSSLAYNAKLKNFVPRKDELILFDGVSR